MEPKSFQLQLAFESLHLTHLGQTTHVVGTFNPIDMANLPSRLKQTNNLTCPTSEFHLNDKIYRSSINRTSHRDHEHGHTQAMIDKSKRLLVCNDTVGPTKIVLWTTNLVSYNSKSISRKKDTMLESLQKQVTELQQAFVKSQSYNMKLRFRLVCYDYAEAESSFHTPSLLVMVSHPPRLECAHEIPTSVDLI